MVAIEKKNTSKEKTTRRARYVSRGSEMLRVTFPGWGNDSSGKEYS